MASRRSMVWFAIALAASAGAGQAGGPPAGDVEGEPTRVAPGGGATVIDFDDVPDGTVITTQYPEATFSSDPGEDNVSEAQDLGSSLPNFICTALTGNPQLIDCVASTFLDFTNPVEGLSFLGVGINDVGAVAEVNVFVGGNPAGTVDVIGQGDPLTPVLVDLGSFSNVTRIEIVNIVDGGGIGWDDFAFGVIPVELQSLGID